VYAEDQWTVNDRFNVLYGVRLDVPTISSRPPTNPLIETIFGRDTHEMPTGNVQFSPRVGFNWDVTGKQADQLRGYDAEFTFSDAPVPVEEAPAEALVSSSRKSRTAAPVEAPVEPVAAVADGA